LDPLHIIAVTSAYEIIEKSVELGISLTYIRKSNGPSTEPCGTTVVTASKLDLTFNKVLSQYQIISVHCIPAVRSHEVIDTTHYSITINFVNSILWYTLSNAFDRSINILAAFLFASRFPRIS